MILARGKALPQHKIRNSASRPKCTCIPPETQHSPEIGMTRITASCSCIQKKCGYVVSEAIITPESEKTMPAFLKNKGMRDPYSRKTKFRPGSFRTSKFSRQLWVP
ncbi:MAG: hypothetical protein VX417_10900 [SAR324 cluster bacterium]|nr:hypothetical protein [SAR324 cluster bacterium]